MRFGHFDDAAREYVITTPDTPYPWINYLGCEKFFGMMSNTSGGYCFYRDSRLRRITRYRYNNVPLDSGGRYFYVNDGGTVWCPGQRPAHTKLDAYECRHGMGYTRITGEKNGLRCSQLAFVPLGINAEVHQVTLTNTSGAAKKVSLFSFVEFCLFNAYDDMTNYQRNFSTGEVEIDGPVIYHKTEYRERRDHFAFWSVNAPVSGFDTDRDEFVGLYNGYGNPQVPQAGRARNTVASGWAPAGSHWLEVELAPGEEKSFVFMLGYVENPPEKKFVAPGIINKERAREMIARFDTPQKAQAALDELRKYWDGLLATYSVTGAPENVGRMVNIWQPYQVMVTFNMSRSTSFFETGIGRGMGFRDSSQDMMGFAHLIPSEARQRLLDIAATQFKDGGCYHQYQPLTKRGNNEIGGGFNDDPLWLIMATAAYIKETGDWDILKLQVPYDNNPDDTGTLFDHLRNSFRHVTNNIGPHGLPLIGRADWNDCLNLNCFSTEPNESFQTCGNKEGKVAESVLIAGMFCYCGPDYRRMCQAVGEEAEAAWAGDAVKKMEGVILQHGYDGEWFLRAYDSFGKKIGGKECDEGRIYIESQGFCTMAGIGLEKGCVKSALDSVKKHLDTEYGIILHNPAYTSYRLELGEISSYPPGYKENAGIFCHNNPWIGIGETVLGRGARAFEVYRKVTPSFREENSEIHRLEPYCYAQMIAGKDAPRHGEAKNSWLTGAASWMLILITQYILGVRAGFDGLVVDPCIPADWKEYTVTRKFRGATYVVNIKNPQGVEKGVKSISVDGQAVTGNVLPLFAGGTHTVEVVLG